MLAVSTADRRDYGPRREKLDRRFAELQGDASGDTLEACVQKQRFLDDLLADQRELWDDFRFFDLLRD